MLEPTTPETDPSHFDRRRNILPMWIKTFIWVFFIFGCLAPVALVFGALGYSFSLSLYGFDTENPISTVGLGIIGLFLFKGIIAYGLWFEKSWAINLGIVDALLGIIICVIAMLPIANNGDFTFRLELILLIPYLIKLFNIRKPWNKLRTN